jgi:hypothetical protein
LEAKLETSLSKNNVSRAYIQALSTSMSSVQLAPPYHIVERTVAVSVEFLHDVTQLLGVPAHVEIEGNV